MSLPPTVPGARPFEDMGLETATAVTRHPPIVGGGDDPVVVRSWDADSELPGLTVIDGAISAADCAEWMDAARHRGPGFTDASVPWYQNRKLDWREKIFRRNTRAVICAGSDMQAVLWRAVSPFVPPSVAYDGYGDWDAHSPNDAWRFYRYEMRAADGVESSDCFPPHHDSTTVKQRGFASWLTILVYVSAEGSFAGGGTAFFSNRRCPGTAATDGSAGAKPVAVVAPKVGRAVVFYHTGHQRLLHAGCQLQRIGEEAPTTIAAAPEEVEAGESESRAVLGAKTVLRSDVMYTLRDGTATISLRPTPPFDMLEDSDEETVQSCPLYGWGMPERMPLHAPTPPAAAAELAVADASSD
jgi:hypothetical protein